MIAKPQSPRPSAPLADISTNHPAAERRPLLARPLRTDLPTQAVTPPGRQSLNPLSAVHFAVHPEMVELLNAAGKLTDPELMRQAALEREATRTTGIGTDLGYAM